MKKIGGPFPAFKQHSGNFVRTAVSLVLVLTALALPALGQEAGGNLTVMTYNVNEGTDFLQVVGATNAIQFLLGVGDIVTQVQGTNPPERMQGCGGADSGRSPNSGQFAGSRSVVPGPV